MGTIINPTPAATMLEEQRLGYIGCSLTETDSTAEPQIIGNVEVAGSLASFASAESITGWSALSNGDVYVKIIPDTGAGTVSAEFTSTAPTWDTVKQGWYGAGGYAADRYIFKLNKTSSTGYEDKRYMNKSGKDFEIDLAPDQELNIASAVTFSTVNTGNGDNEVYPMDQDVRTVADVEFASITTGNEGIGTNVYEIGAWDMDATATVLIDHGLTGNFFKIRNVSIFIIDDSGNNMYPIDRDSGSGAAGYYSINNPEIAITRVAGGAFDSTLFNDTGINRGWVLVSDER